MQVNEISGEKIKSVICSVHLFLWYKCPHHGQFQATKGNSLNAEFGRHILYMCMYTHTHTHTHTHTCIGFPGGLDGKESACNARDPGSDPSFNPWVRKIPWRREWLPPPAFLLEKTRDRGAWRATVHGGHKESDTTDWLSIHIHIHVIYICIK